MDVLMGNGNKCHGRNYRSIDMKESQILEFKKSLSEINEIIETISAFANTKGGKIIVGVEENKDGSIKKVVGVVINGREIENITNEIKQNTDPIVYPSVVIEEIDGKEILTIEIKESSLKPVFSKGKAYLRVGKCNVKLSAQKMREIMTEKKDSFTDLACEEAKLTDIDEQKVRWVLKKDKSERSFDINPEISLKEALNRLKLIKNGKFTNAGILLFGKTPQHFLSQSEIRCARFKGIEPLEFIDMKVLDGNIIDQRERALKFVQEHITLHAKIVGAERVEKWEYPLEAVREAITNAICHRDYQLTSNIQVRIFDDRIEIWGCGSLPKELTLEDLKKKHDSIPRNPSIAKNFFLIKFIEQWGTGTNRIIKECLHRGLPEPLFEIFSGNVVVTLRKFRLNEENIKSLNERQKKAIDFIQQNGKISSKEYCEINSVVKDTANRDIQELLAKGLLTKEGNGKKVKYILR